MLGSAVSGAPSVHKRIDTPAASTRLVLLDTTRGDIHIFTRTRLLSHFLSLLGYVRLALKASEDQLRSEMRTGSTALLTLNSARIWDPTALYPCTSTFNFSPNLPQLTTWLTAQHFRSVLYIVFDVRPEKSYFRPYSTYTGPPQCRADDSHVFAESGVYAVPPDPTMIRRS